MLTLLLTENSMKLPSLDIVYTPQLTQFENIATVVDKMRRDIKSALRDDAALRVKATIWKQTYVHLIFQLGSMCSIGCLQPTEASKLVVRWPGPARGVHFKLPLVAAVEDLLSGKRRDTHVAGLGLFHDASLSFTEDLTTYLAYQVMHLIMHEYFKGIR